MLLLTSAQIIELNHQADGGRDTDYHSVSLLLRKSVDIFRKGAVLYRVRLFSGHGSTSVKIMGHANILLPKHGNLDLRPQDGPIPLLARRSIKVRPWVVLILFVSTCLILPFIQTSYANPPSPKIHVIQLNDAGINPITAEYIIHGIDRAYEAKAQCLVIMLDTPGGLLDSTRHIVKKMLTSKVPIVVYIAPSGSRAGSAGVFLTYASHVAAMAPSTNIGAAHPVQMAEGVSRREGDWDELKELIKEMKASRQETKILKEEEEIPSVTKNGEAPQDSPTPKSPLEKEEFPQDADPMSRKILNDTVAFVKAIAKERHRNVEWAVESVTRSSSITAQEALEKGVVEILADNLDDLLRQLDGRVITLNSDEARVLKTKDASVEKEEMDARQKFFNILANPNIAYILMILGFYGLLFELTHPGFGVPGVLGAIFLILAFYSMQTLPTNYAGLALMILGMALLVAEAFVPGFGLLTLGGLVSLVLGSLLLFDSVDPVMRVSKSVILAVSFSTAAISVFLLQSVIRAQRARILGGQKGLVGESGEARTEINAAQSGTVFIHGELWNAQSDEMIRPGDKIRVIEVKGLKLKVEKGS